MASRRKYDLVVVGEVNPDLILCGGAVEPAFGQVEKLVEDASLTPGSSSVIFACGAARLGLKVAFIGKVGDDVFGRFMLQQMQDCKIDTRGIVIDPHLKTGLSVILSRGNDRAILTYLGTIAALRYEDIDFSILEQAGHLHLGSYYMLDDLRPEIPRLFRKAVEMGLSTSLDTNYDPSEQWSDELNRTLKYTGVFLPNEKELLAISRKQDVDSALAELNRTVPVMGVKLGPHGGAARQGTESLYAPALKLDVVDTTGAGDSFDAGFIYGYLKGWTLERTLRLACICGSLSTRASGGTTTQATLSEAELYLA